MPCIVRERPNVILQAQKKVNSILDIDLWEKTVRENWTLFSSNPSRDVAIKLVRPSSPSGQGGSRRYL